MEKLYHGDWWLPNAPDERISGVINFSDKRQIVLDLKGQLGGTWIEDFFYEIHGIATGVDTKEELFFKALQAKKVFNKFSTRPQTIFQVETILWGKGQKIESLGEKFTQLILSNKVLQGWVTYTGIDTNLESGKLVNSTTKYIQPTPIVLLTSTKVSISICFEAKRSFGYRKIQIQERPTINIKFSDALDFLEVMEWKQSMEYFFSVFWKDSIQFTECELITEKAGRYSTIFSKQFLKIEGDGNAKGDFEDFKNNAKDYITNWFVIYPKYEIAINYFLKSYMAKYTTQEDKFLGCTGAIEAIYKEDHQNVRKVKLDSAIEYIQKHGPAISFHNLSDFVSRAVITRNYWAHFDKSKQNKKFDFLELSKANGYLSHCIFCYFYKKITEREIII